MVDFLKPIIYVAFLVAIGLQLTAFAPGVIRKGDTMAEDVSAWFHDSLFSYDPSSYRMFGSTDKLRITESLWKDQETALYTVFILFATSVALNFASIVPFALGRDAAHLMATVVGLGVSAATIGVFFQNVEPKFPGFKADGTGLYLFIAGVALMLVVFVLALMRRMCCAPKNKY